MSYTRIKESGFYIYPCVDNKKDGVQFTTSFISNKELNVFLYKLFTKRPIEVLKRICDGRNTIKKYRRGD